MKISEIEIKPCPFCGSDNLYAGAVGHEHQGVQCQSCGVILKRRYPEYLPENLQRLAPAIALDKLDELILELAIAAWNCRAPAHKLKPIIPKESMLECPSSPNQIHCDHRINGWVHYTQPQEFKCCYCSRVRTEKPVISGNTVYKKETRPHGPYAPDERVTVYN